VGDSIIRHVFWATVRKLDKQRAAEMSLLAAKHVSLEFKKGCVEIHFLWDPFLNSTGLMKELENFRPQTESRNSTQVAAMLVGTGLWFAKDFGSMFLNGFEDAINRASTSLPLNARDTNGVIVPPLARHGSANLVLFAPVSEPIQAKIAEVDPVRAAKLTPEKVRAMNDYLRDVASRDDIEILWSYDMMIRQHHAAYEDGLHVVEDIADRQADIFLNMRCNSEPSLDHHPFDRTCCNLPPSLKQEQQILIVMAAIMTIWALYGSMKPRSEDDSGPTILATAGTTRASGILALGLLYCFVADRTQIFDQFQKVADQQIFLRMTALVLLAGLLTIRKSGKGSGTSIKPKGTNDVQTFMSRDQTDEWKGWMQFVILIYHYTGMSAVLWVYQVVRLLVASYLFMTGYGHTLYFLNTNNFSLRRVTSVLVRLNLLCCLLAYVMRTDYNFYYFPALSSFWFLVVYLTVRICHQPNVVPRLLTLKILISAILVRLLVRTPGILELIFSLLQNTCNMNVDVGELRFRLSLDAYIVYAGMFAAAMYQQLTGALPCSTTCLATQIKRVPSTAQVISVMASVIALPAYFVVIRRCPDKYDYNWWHPMISPLPVLAFVVLRNSTGLLREFHSGLFAWLGRFSLETFILQYHIWLAADTKALLSLGLWSRDSVAGVELSDRLGLCFEFTLITALFLWTSWAVSHATNVLTSSIVEGPKKMEAPHVLDIITWRRRISDSTPRSSQENGSLTGQARSRSEHVEKAYGQKEDIKVAVSLDQEGVANRKTSGLATRVGLMLLLMWIGNWVRRQLSPLMDAIHN
jgi:N-acetylneuraminate 9-O-acetyltransferase